jgi:hypothetical protein
MPLSDRLAALLSARVDGRRLVVPRVMVGLGALARGVEADRILGQVLAPGRLRLPYLPVPAIPAWAVRPLVIAWGGAALLFALGLRPRLSGGVLIAIILYTLALDQQTYSNHLYLLAWIVSLLLFGLPASRSAAAVGQGLPAPALVPAWPVFLLKVQLSVVYFFSALAKVTPDFVSGGLLRRHFRHEGMLAMPAAWARVEVLAPVAIAAILLELFLAFAPWSPRLRKPAAWAAIGFHLVLPALIEPFVAVQLMVFGVEMLALFWLFLADAEDGPWARG